MGSRAVDQPGILPAQLLHGEFVAGKILLRVPKRPRLDDDHAEARPCQAVGQDAARRTGPRCRRRPRRGRTSPAQLGIAVPGVVVAVMADGRFRVFASDIWVVIVDRLPSSDCSGSSSPSARAVIPVSFRPGLPRVGDALLDAVVAPGISRSRILDLDQTAGGRQKLRRTSSTTW